MCSPCICCLTLRRIKQFSNVFVPKEPVEYANLVWKMGFARFVFSTTVNVIVAVKHLTKKKQFLKIIDRGPYLVGFSAMQIMNFWGILFHPVNVLSPVFAI